MGHCHGPGLLPRLSVVHPALPIGSGHGHGSWVNARGFAATPTRSTAGGGGVPPLIKHVGLGWRVAPHRIASDSNSHCPMTRTLVHGREQTAAPSRRTGSAGCHRLLPPTCTPARLAQQLTVGLVVSPPLATASAVAAPTNPTQPTANQLELSRRNPQPATPTQIASHPPIQNSHTHTTRPPLRISFRPCLVLQKFCKNFQILYHIEFLDVYIEY